MNVNRNHYQSSMVRVVGLGMHTVRGLLTSTFWQSLVGTVSQISCFFSVHSCRGTILQTGFEISVHFLVGKGKHASLWTIPATQKIEINHRFLSTLFHPKAFFSIQHRFSRETLKIFSKAIITRSRLMKTWR